MTPSGKYRQVRSATCSIIGCFAALVSILLLSPSEINAGPKVTAHTEYYAIRGSNARELRAQMDKLGVPHSDGKIWDAFTRNDINWRFWSEKTRDGCRITSVNTTVSTTYTLPRWVDRSVGSSALQTRWDEFITALELHEEGHRDIAVEAAARIEQAIKTMGARGSCRELEQAANALGRSIVEDCQREQEEYDNRTGHGRTQGAIFP